MVCRWRDLYRLTSSGEYPSKIFLYFSVFSSRDSGYVMWMVPSLYSCLLCIFMVISGFRTHGVAGMIMSYESWFMVVPLWGTYSVCDGLRMLVRFHLVPWCAEVLVIC